MRNAPSIEIKRHCRKLSEKETDQLVGAVADLIVVFLKRQDNGQPGATGNPNKLSNTHHHLEEVQT